MASLQEWLGRREVREDRITPAVVARFAAMLDVTAPGSSAPQGIHWCLCLPDAPTAELGDDGHPARGGFLPPVDLPRRMWAASEVRFLAPIPRDAVVQRTSTIGAIEEKQGRTGRLVFVTIDHETCAAGRLVVVERQSLVFREAAAGPAVVAAPEPSRADTPPAFRRRLIPREPLLFRYSALTYNAHRIHYDAPYATGVEGYPGLVVQGPLVATLLLDLCAREFGAEALDGFDFRASAPAFCGDAIELVGWIDDDRMRLEAHADGRIAASAEGRLRRPLDRRAIALGAPSPA